MILTTLHCLADANEAYMLDRISLQSQHFKIYGTLQSWGIIHNIHMNEKRERKKNNDNKVYSLNRERRKISWFKKKRVMCSCTCGNLVYNVIINRSINSLKNVKGLITLISY